MRFMVTVECAVIAASGALIVIHDFGHGAVACIFRRMIYVFVCNTFYAPYAIRPIVLLWEIRLAFFVQCNTSILGACGDHMSNVWIDPGPFLTFDELWWCCPIGFWFWFCPNNKPKKIPHENITNTHKTVTIYGYILLKPINSTGDVLLSR